MAQLLIIPDRKNIQQSLDLARQYDAAFEYNDFFWPPLLENEIAIQDAVDFYRSLPRDRSRDTLHGVFLDITPHSDDPQIAAVSRRRIRQSLDIAAALGVKGVVFHTNFIPNFRDEKYMDNFVARNAALWRELLADYPTLEIYIENMFDETPDLLARLAAAMADHPRFGVCFDYAHAMVFGQKAPIGQWVAALAPYVRHMHINDNDFSVDRHWAVGSGRIDWQEYQRFMTETQADRSVLVEVSAPGTREQSLRYLRENGLYPFPAP